MIIQEPVQAAIWHCLNHYDFADAVFLSERLYAEVKSDDTLFLLATAYYRNRQIDHAYQILKDKHGCSPQCRYLFGSCAFEMQKYAEAEAVIMENVSSKNNFEEVINIYGDQAAFTLLLIAKIAAKTERRQRAVDALKRALKINPFLWSSFEMLCKLAEKPDPNSIFQLNELDNLTKCHGSNINNIESVVIANSTPNQDNLQYITTPQQILTKSSVNDMNNRMVFTPEESLLASANSLCMSGFGLLSAPKVKRLRCRMVESSIGSSPNFGMLFEREEHSTPTTPHPTLTEANEQKSFTKKVRAHVGNLINRNEAILKNIKPVFSQSRPNVRRSSRLFSSSYSAVKENNKSPNRNKFATPKSPSRKTKTRLAKCSLNELNTYMDLNTRNRLKKEKSETVTSPDSKSNSAINMNMVNPIQIQKQSAEGLMHLLRDIGRAYLHLSQFNCKSAISEFNNLPSHQFHTTWVYGMLGVAYFEMADYENCVKYFSDIHSKEPCRLNYMDIYSTALWHLQKEVALSSLAQDLVQINKNSPITWVVSGNCFSLHKEHDTAIKFLHRAVQVDPSFPYAYTLLGHEYIMTEELDKAMSCYRNAVRLDPRHYNAWFGIGTIYSKQERFHLAEINYNTALSINNYSSVIMCHIGMVQHAQKKTEKALYSLNMAIKNDPKNALCKFHRGSIYFAIGKYTEALKELEELKEIVPKESLVYYLIGKVYKKLGNTDLALMHFSWATDLDPKGASSQIKEAFDPSIGRSTEMESPASPSAEDGQSEKISLLSLGSIRS
ncbi:Tetratricopeptide repeat [Popillia japonica]|uniref:Cell division cycle protein 27 homolog n=1 Tax=Popillia japonica TaxID=7064 RepID=A0AAW1MEZ4_POPJA